MILALVFATVALFLAAIGIYGVLAYQVSQRSREIGIRMALGAATSSIFSMVLREGAAIVAAGTVLGVAGAFLLSQTLRNAALPVTMDPTVILGVGAVLVVVSVAAILPPARRAAHATQCRCSPVSSRIGRNRSRGGERRDAGFAPVSLADAIACPVTVQASTLSMGRRRSR